MGDFTVGASSIDVAPGTYPAILTALAVKESDEYGEFRVWTFDVLRPDGSPALSSTGEPVTVEGASSMATGPKSKAGKWTAALLGRKPEKGEDVTVRGRPCLVSVIETDDGWPKVADVLPPMVATPAPAATAFGYEQAAPQPVATTPPVVNELPF